MSLDKLTSAAGIISQLGEENPHLKLRALENLNYVMNWFWHEICDHITTLELIWEDESLPLKTRQLASLVASQVLYHLGSYDESMLFAIKAGSTFPLEDDTDYTRKTLATVLDEYVRHRTGGDEVQEDPYLMSMIQNVFENSLTRGDYRVAIGYALECRRLDLFKKVLKEHRNQENLAYCFRLCSHILEPREWRDEVLNVIMDCDLALPDLFHCLILLNDTERTSKKFRDLLVDEEKKLLAYQLAFDLFQDAPQDFLGSVAKRLSEDNSSQTVVDILNGKIPTNLRRFFLYSWNDTDMEIMRESLVFCRKEPMMLSAMVVGHSFVNAGTNSMEFLRQETVLTREATNWNKFICVASIGNVNYGNEEYALAVLGRYLPDLNAGAQEGNNVNNFNWDIEFPIDADEDFSEDAEGDENIQEEENVEGTEDGEPGAEGVEDGEPGAEGVEEDEHEENVGGDEQEENVEDDDDEDLEDEDIDEDDELGAEAVEDGEPGSEGVENDEQEENVGGDEQEENVEDEDDEDLEDEDIDEDDELYSFRDINNLSNADRDNGDLFHEMGVSAGYKEGGALFGLGLIHANRASQNVIQLLMDNLAVSSNSVITHGACLGLGLTAMGLNRQDIVETLEKHLFEDNAVVGEAAGISLGLIQLGNFNDGGSVQRIIQYAKLTQHEKILRGIAVGIPLICFGQEEKANDVIHQLTSDKENALLRRAGVMSIGMAFCGTGKNCCIKKLLHAAVTDNCDDVRRAAAIAIGFVLCGDPDQSLSVLQLLEDSYNPHVRNGIALALGISCAGTGDINSLNALKPLTKDPENFVRQGALIASALILVQQNENTNPKFKEYNDLYDNVIKNRYTDELTKIGAILAQGIINAGGRNVTITCKSRAGHIWAQGAVGLFLFTHYWYWYPMALCLPMAFTPTCLIAVNKDLKVPELNFVSKCPASLFAFPKRVDRSQAKSERKRVADAVLSFAIRDLAKRVKMAESEIQKLVDELNSEEDANTDQDSNNNERSPLEESTPEANSYLLKNPARCLKKQLKFLFFPQNGRWEPVIPNAIRMGGFIVLKDRTPGEKVWEVKQPSYDPDETNGVPEGNLVSEPEDSVEKAAALMAEKLLNGAGDGQEKSDSWDSIQEYEEDSDDSDVFDFSDDEEEEDY